MRSKTGWLALLLAAGAALAPGGVRAQSLPGGENLDLAPPDPVIPLPLGHPRMDSVGGLYTAMEFVMLRQTNPIKHQELAYRGLVDVDGAITGDLNGTVVNTDTQAPFIIRGPLAPGNFLGSHTLALSTDDLRGQESYQPGYRLTIGYKFDSGSALEINWMHLVSAKYSASASLIPPNYANLATNAILADTFLFSPVFNFPAEYSGPIGQSVTNGTTVNNPLGQPNQAVTGNGNGTYSHQKLAIGNPGSAFGIWNGANNESILFTQRFDMADVTGKVPWYQSDCTRVYGTSGARFAWFWERFKWRTVDADFLGQSFPEDVANYNNIVSNRMYGAFVGIGFERYLGYGFAIETDIQAAILLDIVKEEAYYQLGDVRAITKAKKAATNFALVPETNANVQLCWYPIEGIQMKVGWNFLAFFDTVQANQQVAFDFRNLDPNWNNRFVRFLDGLNAGIGFIF